MTDVVQIGFATIWRVFSKDWKHPSNGHKTYLNNWIDFTIVPIRNHHQMAPITMHQLPHQSPSITNHRQCTPIISLFWITWGWLVVIDGDWWWLMEIGGDWWLMNNTNLNTLSWWVVKGNANRTKNFNTAQTESLKLQIMCMTIFHEYDTRSWHVPLLDISQYKHFTFFQP